ncbi:YciI family protein [Egibacter rhizosphaerae]|uniref:YciI family protein n=1 Tax=Egibacter rhizosphaerae TaxID=1670831 RepID=A0A411YFT4_9ACTN|nr:YciI family protein [Egibacter rhizosphaerae]QBI20090.1 YciI family protein [Egibacter rhizosphaerae]
MRFMIIRKADAATEAGELPTEDQMEAMTAYNEELLKAGVLAGGEGLQPSSKGARVTFSGGTPSVVDGPFTETKELIAGFTLIEVRSREEAIEWVKRWPESDVELELRQVFAPEDFGDAYTPELEERETRMAEQLDERSADETS